MTLSTFDLHEELTPTSPSIPHNREMEEAVIGAVLINPACYLEISRILVAEDFFIHRHRWMWEVYASLFARRIPIDYLTVTNELEKQGRLAEIGGSAFVTVLSNQVPNSLSAVDYAKQVREYSDRRKGINFANNIATDAYLMEKEFDLRGAAMKILKEHRGETKRIDTDQAAQEVLDQLDKHEYCIFGIPGFDRLIGGHFPEELEILAGYQGSGKSALMIQTMRANAEKGKRVMGASLEMSSGQVWMRMACADLEIDLGQVRSGRVSEDGILMVKKYALDLADQYRKNIVFYPAPMTPADILSAALMEQPDLICIDHLGLIQGKDPKQNMIEWYNQVIRFLRMEIAQAEKLNIMLLHQINRASFRESRPPSMHDLAWAGENDPDSVYLLYRKPEEPINGLAQMTISRDKARFGWTGTQDIMFHLPKQKFYDAETRPKY